MDETYFKILLKDEMVPQQGFASSEFVLPLLCTLVRLVDDQKEVHLSCELASLWVQEQDNGDLSHLSSSSHDGVTSSKLVIKCPVQERGFREKLTPAHLCKCPS